MTTRGLLNVATNGRQYDFNQKTLSHTAQADFVTLYNFLNGSVCQALGIVRRAYNFGSSSEVISAGFQFVTSPGTGMNYFDQPAAAGNNAWALFEFTQATPKFWVLIQFAAEYVAYNINTFGNAPGAPARNQSFNGNLSYPYVRGPALAVAVGFRKNGASPWSGTTNNNGADTKSSPVWASGSVAFPRPNQFGGSGHTGTEGDTGSGFFLSDASGMMTVREAFVATNTAQEIGQIWGSGDSVFDSYSGLMHIIVKEDTLLILSDNKGYGNYNVFYFGRYQTMKAEDTEDLNWANYVCLHQHTPYDGYQILHRFGTQPCNVYGTRYLLQNYANVTNTVAQIQLPKMQGGANHVFTNECRGVTISDDAMLTDPNSSTPIYLRFPNRPASDPSGRTPGSFDLFNIPIALYEDSQWYGHLGEIDFIKLTRDLPTHATLNNRQFAVIGGSSSKNTIKLVIPWDGVSQPGMQGATRTGILW